MLALIAIAIPLLARAFGRCWRRRRSFNLIRLAAAYGVLTWVCRTATARTRCGDPATAHQ
jgi:hypothetical protein